MEKAEHGELGAGESIYRSYWDWYVKGWYEGHPRATGQMNPWAGNSSGPGTSVGQVGADIPEGL
jgi:hypothetical protein